MLRLSIIRMSIPEALISMVNCGGGENDEIGIGYAYLTGADDSDIDSTNAFETYARVNVSKFSDITIDIQYIDDNLKHEDNRKGLIYGVRANAYF